MSLWNGVLKRVHLLDVDIIMLQNADIGNSEWLYHKAPRKTQGGGQKLCVVLPLADRSFF